MSTNYHTPITTGAAANAAVVNAPLAQLDAQVTANTSEITAARGSAASLDDRLDTSLTDAGNLGAGAVSAQSMVLLGTAAAATGDAVRYDEFTVEHAAGGGHSADIIDQAEMSLTSAADANGEAVRYEEWTVGHNDNGTHKYVSLVTIVYQDMSVGGSSGTAAAALTEYDYDDPASAAEEVKIRFPFIRPSTEFTELSAYFEAYVDGTTYASAVQLAVTGVGSTETVITAGSWTKSAVEKLDITSLTARAVYEATLSLCWDAEEPASGDTLYMRNVTVMITGTLPT